MHLHCLPPATRKFFLPERFHIIFHVYEKNDPVFNGLLFIRYNTRPAAVTPVTKSLEECIVYALAHQTNIRQSLIDEKIMDREIKIRLSDWYPQINFSGNYQYNFQQPTSIFNNQANPVGTTNSAGGYFGLNQTII